MAYIEPVIIARLLADTAIKAIVSTRIYYMEAPADVTYPYILVQVISDPDENTLCGKDGSNPRLQIDSIDDNDTVVNVKALDLAVRASLNDYSGSLGGITIYLIERAGYREIRESEKIIRLSRDFIVHYER